MELTAQRCHSPPSRISKIVLSTVKKAHLPSVSAYYPVTTHPRPCVSTRHTTGIERPWCVDRLPSHISKMVASTVCVGGPGFTVGSTIFELEVRL